MGLRRLRRGWLFFIQALLFAALWLDQLQDRSDPRLRARRRMRRLTLAPMPASNSMMLTPVHTTASALGRLSMSG